MRYAAVDIGTNSCRLLVAEADGRQVQPVFRTMITTRIGAGVDQSKRINAEAMDRTLRGLRELSHHVARMEAGCWRVVGTSALREAANGRYFAEQVRREIGWTVDIISGEEEAELSYLGVRCGLPVDKPPLVVDLGGGSTEFMLEDPFPWTMSLPVGAVRATEAALSDEQIRTRLAELPRSIREEPQPPLVLVGGTATTLAAMHLGLTEYCAEMVHGQELTRDQVEYWLECLETMTVEERRMVPGLQPQRADIIVQGIRIVGLIMDMLGYGKLRVSESDILDGIISRLAMRHR